MCAFSPFLRTVGIGLSVAVVVGAAGAGPQAGSALTNSAVNKKSDILFMVFLLKNSYGRIPAVKTP